MNSGYHPDQNYFGTKCVTITSHDKYDPFQPRQWQLAHNAQLELGPKSRLMGILNVTPDSFSDGGKFESVSEAVDQTAKMIEEGADIIDVGGESTKPGADPVDRDQEQERVLPVIEAILERFDTLVSIDTYRADTAQKAINLGAHIVNDIGGLQFDPEMAGVVAQTKAGICLMHNSRKRDVAQDVIEDQIKYLTGCLNLAYEGGIDKSCIIIDPGFGFGKNPQVNLQILDRMNELFELQLPVLTGTSRKRFTGAVLGDEDSSEGREFVTAASSVVARMAGSGIFRVHELAPSRKVLKLADALIASRS